jgi:putative sigma-54 modulation protein
MDINITGRNIDLDPALKSYIHKRLDKIEKLYSRIYKCEVILDVEKLRHNAEVILYLKRTRIISKETSPDIYSSIDNAADSIKKQLRRLRGKVSTKRKKAVFDRIMRPIWGSGAPVAEIEEEIIVPEERGEILKEDLFPDKPMSVEEARLELEVLGKTFMMFKNSDTGKASVIYKKNDGNYGLVEAKF